MKGPVRPLVSFILLAVLGIDVSVASAQVTDPADPNVHGVIGVVTFVSNDSIKLRADNGERELRITKSTSVLDKGRRRGMTNDLVLRRTKLSDFVKVGDEAWVTYRDENGALTAVKITIPVPGRQPNR